MSSTYATIDSAQDLIRALHHPSPEIPLVALGNSHNESLRSLVEIFGKATSPAVTPSLPVREAYQ